MSTVDVCANAGSEPGFSNGVIPERTPKAPFASTTTSRKITPRRLEPLTRNMRKPSRAWNASPVRRRLSAKGCESSRSVRSGSAMSSSGTLQAPSRRSRCPPRLASRAAAATRESAKEARRAGCGASASSSPRLTGSELPQELEVGKTTSVSWHRPFGKLRCEPRLSAVA